jgi:cytochrome c-type biogenesis protein CcmH
MLFWIAAAGAAVIVALWLVRPLVSGRRAAPPRAAHDMQVFRDQLRAVDRDLERGVLAEAEAEGARAEISRRLLAAAEAAERDAPADPAPRRASLGLAAALALVMVGGGAAIYAAIGQPGLPDQPLAQRLDQIRTAGVERPTQAEAERLFAERREAARADAPAPEPAENEARLRELVDRLRGILDDRPTDVGGRRLLADSLLRLDDLTGARAAMERVVELQRDNVPAEDRATLAETMILAAGGYVSPQAERQVQLALQTDETNPVARYYAGLALAQQGNYPLALRFWRRLLEEGPQDAPWIAPIRAQIGALAEAAGEPVEIPAPGAPPAPGPTQGDMEAARDMDPEDRMAMIEGMVARLEDRLHDEGGDAEEWARLINAYGVLDRPEDAARIWADARRAFADAPPEVLDRLREVARRAGVETGE